VGCRQRILSFLIAFGFATPLLSIDALSAPAKSPPAMEKYSRERQHVRPLQNPEAWNVDSRALANGKVITVSDPKSGSVAIMRILKMRDPARIPERSSPAPERTCAEPFPALDSHGRGAPRTSAGPWSNSDT